MRKNFGAHASIYPQPVFILAAYGEDGTPCAMNAAWGGISDDKELSFCVSPSHRTVKDLLARGAFTVSMGTAEQVVACDYVGLVSGNQVPDKFARAGFHATKSEFVDAPCIDELPIAVSCRVVSYDPESCRLVGKIVNVSVDEAYLTPEGKVDVDKVAPITYDSFNKTYVRLGAVVGRAFHDGAALKCSRPGIFSGSFQLRDCGRAGRGWR